MLVVVVCEMYGWTYDEYMAQPVEFLMLIQARMRVDAKREEQRQNKAKKVR